MNRLIYLDNAATTYPKPESVYTAIDFANRNLAFNAGRGSYKEARTVAELIQSTREKLASLVKGANSSMVSFESSATEALNIIINGIDFKEGDTVYISPFEHNAVVRPLYNLKDRIGINIEVLPFNQTTWEYDENKANDMFLMKKPAACFLTHISNVSGYILPFGVIFAQTKKYNCINILDCSQSLGVLNPTITNTDFIVFAGHKSLYATFGAAGFINTGNIKLSVTKSGGTGSDSLNPYMPETGNLRYEAGSINSVAIAGLNASVDWVSETPILNHELELTEYLIEGLTKCDNVLLFVPPEGKRVGIVSFAIPNYSAEDIGSILSEEFGICVRTGYHCCPFIHTFIGSKLYGGTVRVSLSWFTKKDELDSLINAIKTF